MLRFTPKVISVLKEGYSFAGLRADALAGLTVAIVALPLAMAIGIASGATPEQGLITAVIAGFLISMFGGSRVQIGGPTGAFIVVVHGVIQGFGYNGLLLATLMAGLILVVAGYARFGQLMKFIPRPVITGFTTGIAVIIALTQAKNFIGMHSSFNGGYLAFIANMRYLPVSVGIFSLIIIYLFRKYIPWLPRYLIALIGASSLVYLFNLDVDTIGKNFANISAGISLPSLPEMSFSRIQQMLPSAFTIAFLAGIEALLSATVADGMTGFKHRPNQELIGQGIANCFSALLGGIPATGGIARTVTNITAGGKTPFAGMFHSLFLLLFVVFAANLIKFVPMPALAAILFFVAWEMSEVHRFIRTLKFPGSDRILMILTFLLTIFVDLTVAITVGVALASLLFVVKMIQTIEITSGVNSSFGQDREPEDQREELPKGVEVFSIAGPIFFGIASDIPELLKRVGGMPKILVIRMKFVPFLDETGATALAELIKQCRSKKVEVIFSGLQSQPQKILLQWHKKLGWENVNYMASYAKAISLAKEKISTL